MLIGAAVSVATARRCAAWADGLITVNSSPEHLRQMAEAYRDAGGRGKLYLQVHLSWAQDDETAARIAHEQWRSNVFPPPVCWDLETTDHFDVISERVTAGEVGQVVNVSADLHRHMDLIQQYTELGFEEIYLHHVGQELNAFIDAFGDKVLPQLKGAAS